MVVPKTGRLGASNQMQSANGVEESIIESESSFPGPGFSKLNQIHVAFSNIAICSLSSITSPFEGLSIEIPPALPDDCYWKRIAPALPENYYWRHNLISLEGFSS